MRYFTCLLAALCISAASTTYAADPIGQQLSTSEKPLISKQGTQNPEAYGLYLKGRACLEKRTLSDLKTAVSYFDQAIARDPGYALAYVGLAHVYAVLPDYGDNAAEDHPKAMSAARKALELDPDLSEPHAVLGGQMMAQDWNFSGGIAELKKAVELDPNNAELRRFTRTMSA
jgi:tetratricopeptide (TPR) repeat protein